QGVHDLACYYKSPYLFHLSGRAREASRLLTFIDLQFGREDHDFATSADQKSDNDAFNEYWAYPNGWIAMAAQRMGRFDVAYPAFEYLHSFHQPDSGGFLTHRPQRSDGGTDALTTAHLGLLCLYFGDTGRARGYLEFALSCGGGLRSSHLSHKVAWGAAVLAGVAGEERGLELSTAIADHLVRIQDPDGAWLADQPAHTKFDQTAEIAIWLQEIGAELNGTTRRVGR